MIAKRVAGHGVNSRKGISSRSKRGFKFIAKIWCLHYNNKVKLNSEEVSDEV